MDLNRTHVKGIKKQTDNYSLELKAKVDSLMQNNLQNKKRQNRIVDIRLLKEEKISPLFLFFIQEYLLYLQTII